MAHIIMTHKVENFDKWLTAFDADKPRREEMKMKEVGIYRTVDDKNTFLIHFEVEDVAKVKQMMDDPEMGKKMKAAGVLEPPTVFATEKFR